MMGDLPSAVVEFRTALELDPSSQAAAANLARAEQILRSATEGSP